MEIWQEDFKSSLSLAVKNALSGVVKNRLEPMVKKSDLAVT